MKTSREQFEEWFAPKEAQMERNGLGLISRNRARSAAWDAWQASRQCIKVELPWNTTDCTMDAELAAYVGGFNDGILDAERVIAHAGIKTKTKGA